MPEAVQCARLTLTVSIIFSLDRHEGALGSRVSTEGVAVLCLDAWSGWVQVHVQQRVLFSQHRVIEETAEEVVGEILHVVGEVIQVLGEMLRKDQGRGIVSVKSRRDLRAFLCAESQTSVTALSGWEKAVAIPPLHQIVQNTTNLDRTGLGAVQHLCLFIYATNTHETPLYSHIPSLLSV